MSAQPSAAHVFKIDTSAWPPNWTCHSSDGTPALTHWAALADDDGRSAIATILRSLARQIEAQTKPPRIEEPGWGGKVEARAGDDPRRYPWLRYTTNPNVGYQWVSEFCSPRPWDDLLDPTLIREGVES